MTPKRWLIVAFWVIVIGALLSQFFSANKRLGRADDLSAVQSAPAAPTQQHYYFLNGNSQASVTPAGSTADGAIVKQVRFTVDIDSPKKDSLTCHVFLMNKGNLKATHVQIMVRPYRGAWDGDPENVSMDHPAKIISDDSTLGQFGSLVACPDIAPGQTITQDVVYPVQDASITPGKNPHPEITFDSEQSQPAAPSGPKFPSSL